MQGLVKMIFKSLFTPKWKNSDPQKRIAALTKLDTSKDKHIIIDLALADPTPQVRKAALKKLDDVRVWWKAIKSDTDKNLKSEAESHLVVSFEKSNWQPNDDELVEFFKVSSKPSTAKALLASDQTSDELKAIIVKQLNQNDILCAQFKQGSDTYKELLLPLVKQKDLLAKLIEFAPQAVQSSYAAEQLKQEQAKRLPKQVSEQVKVILAKLNYLREKSDFHYVNTEYQTLTQAFHELDLTWLGDEADATHRKFDTINEKLTSHIAKLQHEHEQQQLQTKLANEKTQLQSELTALIDSIERNFIGLDASDNEALQAQKTRLSTMQKLINDTESLGVSVSLERTQLAKFSKSLEELPKQAEFLSQFKALETQIENIEAITSFEDFAEKTDLFETQFASLNELIKTAPEAISKHSKEQAIQIKKAWLARNSKQLSEFKQTVAAIKKTSADIKRLLGQGRYNVCFGLLKGIETQLMTLPQVMADKLNQELIDVRSELAKIADWQTEISLPKREQLVEEVKTLSEITECDAQVRATEIKHLRTKWNELGFVASDAEKLLEASFNQYAESAFSPCREFFQQKEQQQQEIIAIRQQIIDDVKALASNVNDLSFNELKQQYDAHKAQWRSLAPIDNKLYKALQLAFKQAESPIVERLKSEQQSIKASKQTLLLRAEAELNNPDVFDAVSNLKQIQAQWKALPQCAKHSDSRLWQAFRKVNDAVFTKRDHLLTEKKASEDLKVESITKRFEAISEQDLSALTVDELNGQIDEIDVLIGELKQLKRFDKSLMNNLFNAKKACTSQISTQQTQTKQANYQALFEALRKDGLVPSAWRTETSDLSRLALTVRIEILAERPSPEADQSLRLTQQVDMLQDSLSGGSQTKELLLAQWLGKGPISTEERSLLERVERIFS